MDKYEKRRLDLLNLVEQMGRGGRVRVAAAINKTPDYISRMLYPKNKAGHKGIGEDSVELLDAAYPGWSGQNLTLTEPLPLETLYAREQPAPIYIAKVKWPFKSIEEADWLSIPEPTREIIEQQVKALVPKIDANEKAA
jgi:hypothetical protein